MDPGLLRPDWPAPPTVGATVSTRRGGASVAPWDSLNRGGHVGDDPAAVAENRRRLTAALGRGRERVWLEQVDGTRDLTLDARAPVDVGGVGAFTRSPGVACAVMTADCLPVLFCDRAGTAVAASHAGWRGLAAGVLRATVEAMGVPPGDILAWLGPAIGPA